MATYRVKHGGAAGDRWQVQKSGRMVKTFSRKGQAVQFARTDSARGDELVIEKMNGAVQKRVEIESAGFGSGGL